jgi:hypothetical protein
LSTCYPSLIVETFLLESGARSGLFPFAKLSIPHPECRAVFRTHLAAVVEARGGHVGVAKPFLDLGDIGLILKRIRGGRGAQRMHTEAGH